MESLDIQYCEKESFFFKKSKHFQRGKEFSSYVQSKEKNRGGYNFRMQIVLKWKKKTLNLSTLCLLCIHCYIFINIDFYSILVNIFDL